MTILVVLVALVVVPGVWVWALARQKRRGGTRVAPLIVYLIVALLGVGVMFANSGTEVEGSPGQFETAP